eukprot:4429317-Karenia_brevis.AAC.1
MVEDHHVEIQKCGSGVIQKLRETRRDFQHSVKDLEGDLMKIVDKTKETLRSPRFREDERRPRER